MLCQFNEYLNNLNSEQKNNFSLILKIYKF